ncbi:MAG: GAF domain-containing protein [Desulfuromonas sp.]|nr:GAF domain-containing protein [Desulfuromonas sp.]
MLLLPRRLQSRIILAVTGTLLGTGLIFGWLAARDQSADMLAGARENATVMAANIADSCAHHLLVEDYAALEAILQHAAELPDIRRIQLVEPSGKLILDIESVANGPSRVTIDPARRLVPPIPASPKIIAGYDRLEIWQPIVAGSVLGWLKVDFGLLAIQRAQDRLWRNALLLILVWVMLSTILIVLVLRPIVAAIDRLSAFSGRLDEHKGEQIDVANAVSEIAALGASLNQASTKLLASERQLLDQSAALHQLNRQLRAISRCNETLIRAGSEPELLGDICRIVCEEAGYRMAWVGYAEGDEARTVRPMAWAGAEDGFLAGVDITWADTERGQGPMGTAIREGISLCIEDFATDPKVVPWREEALRRGYRSSIASPLKDESGVIFGALCIYASEAGAFRTGEVWLLEELAGDLAFGIGTLRARAQRRRAEEALRQLNRELEDRVADRTARLEAANKELEAFAYSVSHDLRAPLRHIHGFLYRLRQKIESGLDEESRHFMEAVTRAAKRMDTLIEDLLAFSRMGRDEMRRAEFALDELVQEIIRELEPETRDRNIRWTIAALPVVAGDRAMLRVVLENLIANAIKFTRRKDPAEIEIGSLPPDASETVLFVRDNGAGFDMRYASRLFGVFQRLHSEEEFEGTGIGLANVRRVIVRHGGRTWAAGRVGEGATFYFTLPRRPPDVE